MWHQEPKFANVEDTKMFHEPWWPKWVADLTFYAGGKFNRCHRVGICVDLNPNDLFAGKIVKLIPFRIPIEHHLGNDDNKKDLRIESNRNQQ